MLSPAGRDPRVSQTASHPHGTLPSDMAHIAGE